MRREVALMELMEERTLPLRADSANDWLYSGDGGASAASSMGARKNVAERGTNVHLNRPYKLHRWPEDRFGSLPAPDHDCKPQLTHYGTRPLSRRRKVLLPCPSLPTEPESLNFIWMYLMRSGTWVPPLYPAL